jgi:hypothetical protein
MTPKKGIGYKKKKSTVNRSQRGLESEGMKINQSRGDNKAADAPFVGLSTARRVSTSTTTRENNTKTKVGCVAEGNRRIGSLDCVSGVCSRNENEIHCTKRQRLSLADSFIEIGKKAKEDSGSLSTEGLGMKIGEALKMALPFMAERRILMETLNKTFGFLSPDTVNTATIPRALVSPLRNACKRVNFVTPKQDIVEDVSFDEKIFFTSLEDGMSPVPAITASTHKCRARNDVNEALNRHGTLTHQAAIIHDI